MIGAIEALVAVVALAAGVYYYLISNFNFWKLRGVRGPKPSPLVGNFRPVMKGEHSLGTYLKQLYDEYPDEPMIGFYVNREPLLILKDVELIKAVLIKDFSHFMDRGMDPDKHSPLSEHLFLLEPKRWRPLRMKISPVFTSGKLREMFYLLNECGDQLEKYLEGIDGECVDMRDIAAKFTTDVIGVCAFGLQADALKNENSIFRQMGKRVFDITWKLRMKFRIKQFVPPLYNLIGRCLNDNELEDFFINLTRDTIDYRRKNGVTRHDFVDLLRALNEEPGQIDDIKLTDSLMAAQLFVFFVAGFETSSSTMSNCLFELASNHAVQDKLREEIRGEVASTNGEVTYEGIKRMKYLDKVVNETLRKYPPLMVLMRKTSDSYTFPGTNITVPKDCKVWIPIFAIQRDPRHFPNPEVFDPENFSDEAVSSRHPMTFLSFGDGPRNCIGARFGSIQTKVGLVRILHKFKVDVSDKTDKEYKINPKMFLLTPVNGIHVKVSKCPL